MSVWIKQVTVSNLGPINDLSVDLGKFNLFFGYNETGKTYLTEFILSSIFHNASEKKWSLRDLSGRGRIVVSGLEDSETFFMPSSRKKLEDFWTEDDIGLPLDMARLLVVKGGELALSPDKSGGVDRDVLKSALSQDVKFDQILANISKTVQNCTLVDGEIEGANRGEYRTREDLIKEKQKRNKLLEQVNQEYTAGNIRDLEIQKDRLQSALNIQEHAKCYRAYQIHKEIQQLRQDLDQLPEKKLEELRDSIIDYERQIKETKSLEEKIKQKIKVLQNIRWLEEATSLWESMSLGNAPKAKLVLLILGVVCMFLGMSSALLGSLFQLWVGKLSINVALPILAVILFLAGGTMVGFYIWNMHRWNENVVRSEERHAIEYEYKKRFKQTISGLTGLRSHLSQLKIIEAEKDLLQSSQQDIKRLIPGLENDIQSAFFRIKGEEVSPNKWHSALTSLSKQRTQLNSRLQDKRVELGMMSVDESEYQTEPAEKEYNPDSYAHLNAELEKADEALKQSKHELSSLKQSVYDETGDDQSISWPKLLQHLKELIEETTVNYKKITAQILAGIGMTSVLQKVREQEDEKINRDIKSPEVIEMLYNVTGHLNQLELEGDSIIVKDDMAIYPLEKISTGAREQVQLALRMGIARRITSGEPLFMILDDAFQHSDWIRREKLIDTVIKMTKSGWQMIYLTMDNHICDCILKDGKGELGEDLCYFELE